MASVLGISLGTVSDHLAVLRDSGIVAGTRAGRNVVYTLTPRGEALQALLADPPSDGGDLPAPGPGTPVPAEAKRRAAAKSCTRCRCRCCQKVHPLPVAHPSRKHPKIRCVFGVSWVVSVACGGVSAVAGAGGCR
ncbi:MAG TPA: winged helix-turn-helix domain-containing protein [Trebonia sp.]